MKTLRPRTAINFNAPRIHVLHDDAAVYVLDNTKTRKPRITAEVMASLRDNKRIAIKLCLSVEAVNELFPYSKLSRMIVKAINKGKAFTYRDVNLSDEVALSTTPAPKPVSIDKQFRERQRFTAKQLRKQTAQSIDQAVVLQVA